MHPETADKFHERLKSKKARSSLTGLSYLVEPIGIEPTTS
ncbi:hypothetical protein MTBLM1_30145 [Rhodospirillaceae bacterium LM-1]|nr:hypothetical protein MTBLM1_30145 [Rhodospirillaceae bacterium LM-1]